MFLGMKFLCAGIMVGKLHEVTLILLQEVSMHLFDKHPKKLNNKQRSEEYLKTAAQGKYSYSVSVQSIICLLINQQSLLCVSFIQHSYQFQNCGLQSSPTKFAPWVFRQDSVKYASSFHQKNPPIRNIHVSDWRVLPQY